MKDALIRGATGTLALKVAVVGLAFLNQIAAARWMGAGAFGAYAYLLAWVSVLGVVARFGTDSLLIRLTAAAAINRRWGEVRGVMRFGYRVVASSGGLLVLIGAGLLLTAPDWLDAERRDAAWYALPLLLAVSLLGVGQSLLYGFKQPWRSQCLEALPRLILLPAMAASYFWLGRQLPASVGILCVLLTTMVALLVGIVWVRASLPTEAGAARLVQHTREWLGTAFPLFCMAFLRMLSNQSDLLLVGLLIPDPAAVGFYSVALRLAEFSNFGLQAVNNTLAPMIAELHSQNRHDQLQALVTRAAYGVTGFSAAVCLGLFALGDPLLALFGPGFGAAYAPLLILLGGQLINAATGSVGYLMTMTGHQAPAARMVAVSSAVGLGLSLWLIPRFGLVGAAIANASAVVSVNLAMLAFVMLRLGINPTIFRRFHARPT